MGTFTNSGDPDEMQHKAAFHQGLHCFKRVKKILSLKGRVCMYISDISRHIV